MRYVLCKVCNEFILSMLDKPTLSAISVAYWLKMIPTLPTMRIGMVEMTLTRGCGILEGMECDVKFKINGNILTITGIE